MDRKSIGAEIAARVKQVPGWTVTMPRSLGGAYKITAPSGDVVQIHRSPSDVNFDKTIWRDLNKLGFDKDEEAYARQREVEKKKRLQAEAKAANEKARTLAAHATARQKAAGPYLVEPEIVELSWFTKQHPAPWMRWVWMTPELARYLVDNHNTDNRPISRRSVNEYKVKLKSPAGWGLTHQGMAMDTRAVIQDAQHRLTAIAEVGEEDDPDLKVGIPFFVGMPVENFKIIDEGKNRQAQDLFGKDGESYGIVIQGAVRLAVAFTSKIPRSAVKTKTANATIYDAFQDDSEPIRQAARWAASNSKKVLVGQSSLAAARYLIGKRNGYDNPYVNAFFYGLVNGAKQHSRVLLDDLDPRTVVRNNFRNARANRRRMDGLTIVCLIIQAWNNVLLEKTPTYMRFTDDSAIPEILICRPEDAAIPTMLRGEITTEDA